MKKLIHKWKVYKIYLIKPGEYQLTYFEDPVMTGTAEEIKAKLNNIIDLHYEQQKAVLSHHEK